MYNPDSEVICDKGCIMKMSRREYEGFNCFIHLANIIFRQGKEIIKLNDEVGRVRCQLETCGNIKSRQSKEISGQGEETTKIDDEQREPPENFVNRQEEELQNIILFNKPPYSYWEINGDMKISLGQSHILECADTYVAAKFVYPLDASNSCIKIQILNISGGEYPIGLGLTRKEHSIDNGPLYLEGSICYLSNGSVRVDGKLQKFVQEWEIGAIVECGIKFPNDFLNDGTTSVEVYFSVNEHPVFKNVMKMPQKGYFPTIGIFKGDKVNYWRN